MTRTTRLMLASATLSLLGVALPALGQITGGTCPCDNCVMGHGFAASAQVLPPNDKDHAAARAFIVNTTRQSAIDKAKAAERAGVLCLPNCTASNLTYDVTEVPAGNSVWDWEIRGTCSGKAAVLVKPVGLAPGALKTATTGAPLVEIKPGQTTGATVICPGNQKPVTLGGKTTCAPR